MLVSLSLVVREDLLGQIEDGQWARHACRGTDSDDSKIPAQKIVSTQPSMFQRGFSLESKQ